MRATPASIAASMTDSAAVTFVASMAARSWWRDADPVVPGEVIGGIAAAQRIGQGGAIQEVDADDLAARVSQARRRSTRCGRPPEPRAASTSRGNETRADEPGSAGHERGHGRDSCPGQPGHEPASRRARSARGAPTARGERHPGRRSSRTPGWRPPAADRCPAGRSLSRPPWMINVGAPMVRAVGRRFRIGKSGQGKLPRAGRRPDAILDAVVDVIRPGPA